VPEKPEKNERSSQSVEKEDLEDAARTALLQWRMILPGIQTLFGFQLAVVFTEPFGKMEHWYQMLHIGALLCTAFAIGIVIMPAAYHRQVEPGYVSKHFLGLVNRMLLIALVPLMVSLSVEVYLLVMFLFKNWMAARGIGAGLFVMFTLLWFVFPAVERARRGSPRAMRASTA
jgi:hypothetical protein